jgi:DNA polymerase-1
MSYILEPGEEHSLRAVAKRCGLKQEKLHYSGDFSEFTPEMLTYNQRDAEVTLQVFEVLEEQLRKDSQAWNLYENIDLPYLEIIFEMHREGLPIDKEKLDSVEQEVRREMLRLETRLHELVPYVPGKEKIYKRGYHKASGVTKYNHCELLSFNPNSTAHIEYALRLAGWSPNDKSKKTKSGKFALSKDVLSSLESEFELAKTLLEYRKYVKLHGTYLLKWKEATKNTDRIYGNFNYAATLTGRLSSSGGTAGNLQNIPRRGSLGGQMRSIVSSTAECDLVIGDLSNFEARGLAYYLAALMGDDELAKNFVAGLDLHSFNANKIGIARDEAKTLLYLYLYGGQAGRLAESLRVPKERAEEILKSLEKNFPALANFRKVVVQALKKNKGILHDKLGRRLVYRDIFSRDRKAASKAERQIVNALLQGLNASVMRMLSVKSRRLVKASGGKFVASVHDEVLILIPKKFSELVAKRLTEIWSTDTTIMPVPIIAKFGAVSNWNEGHN